MSISLEYMTFFLKAYWNEMADMDGGFEGAVDQFNKESDDLVFGLRRDLETALSKGLIHENLNWDNAGKFWHTFDRLITLDDAKFAVSRLRRR